MPHAQPDTSRPARSPTVEMLVIAAPVVATMMSYTVMQLVDGLMVSRISPDPVYVAAQGNGGLFAFLPVAVAAGLLTVVNTYVSQHLGAGQPRRAPAYPWNGVWIACVWWLAIMVPLAIVARRAFALLDHSPELIELESGFARILLFGGVLTVASRCVAQFFYGMHRPWIIFWSVCVSNVVNFIVNTLLVYGDRGPFGAGHGLFGWWCEACARFCARVGIEPMGVRGSAISTVIGTGIELAIPLAMFLSAGLNRAYGTRSAWRPRVGPLVELLRLGWPAALTFGSELICWGYMMIVLIGSFGEVHNAAGFIALRFMNVAFMPAVGVSIAVTAQVGKCMGMGRPDLAAGRAWLGLRITMVYMGLCGLAFVVFREQLIGFFMPEGMAPDKAAELVAVGSQVMIAAAIFQLFDAMGITMNGALRGAGDTVWPGVVTVVLAWTCLVGGGHAFKAWAPQLGSMGPWAAASVYIILLGLLVVGRFMRGRWRNVRLVTPEAGPAAGAAA